MDGSAYLDLLGLVRDHQLGLAKIGSSVGGRLSFFLPAWNGSAQFLLQAVRQGYSLPFVRGLSLAFTPVETPLPRLQFKQGRGCG